MPQPKYAQASLSVIADRATLALPSPSLRAPRASASAPLWPSPVPSPWPWGTDASWWVHTPGEGELCPHHTLI